MSGKQLMKATFSNDAVNRLLGLYLDKCRRYNNDFNLAAGNNENIIGTGCSEIFGPAHEVMFFIGFVAENGEDTLIDFRSH